MTVHRLPVRADAFIFDVDSTLYTCPAYADAQTRAQIERLAVLRGKSPDGMELEVEARRAAWSAANGGRKLSLGNAFVDFGVPIEESVRWREESARPEDFLSPDPLLRAALNALRAAARLSVVTNNPSLVGRKTLEALGVADLFDAVIGLDSYGVSKPHPAPFLGAAAALETAPEFCVAVGDRFDIDIALPLELGMGGILVESVADVYRIPDLFRR